MTFLSIVREDLVLRGLHCIAEDFYCNCTYELDNGSRLLSKALMHVMICVGLVLGLDTELRHNAEC